MRLTANGGDGVTSRGDAETRRDGTDGGMGVLGTDTRCVFVYG